MKKDIKQLHAEFIRESKYTVCLSPKTVEAYEQAFTTLIKIMPALTTEMLTPDMITEFFKRLETRERIVGRGEIRTGVKPSTIETYRSKMGAFFSWLVRNGHIEENPLRHINRPTVHYDSAEYIKGDKMGRVMAAINFNIQWENNLIRKRNECMILLGLCCGIRRNEMLNISLNDIDLRRGRETITIRKETSKSVYTREVPLNDQLLPKLTDYIRERHRHNMQTPYLIVSGRNDDKLSLAGFKHVMDRIRNESGVKFNYHQLRHTFAVNFLKNGGDVIKLSQILGHTDIRMTIKYVRRFPAREIMANMQGIRLDNLL